MNVDVLIELVHLSIDVATDESLVDSVLLLECSESTLPEQLQTAHQERRAGMDPLERVRWLRAAKEIEIQEEKLDLLLEALDAVSNSDACFQWILVPV